MYAVELNQPVSHLPGIGEGRSRELARIGITSVYDLLMHVPRGYEDRRSPVPFSEATPERPVNTTATVVAQSYIGGGKALTLKVHLRDETGIGVLVCFGRNFLSRKLPEGKTIRVFGYFQQKFGDLQASAFDFADADTASSRFDRILPMYPLGGKLGQHDLRRAIGAAVQRYGRGVEPDLPDWLIRKRDLLPTDQLLRGLHDPPDMDSADHARRALVYAELFFLQLSVARRTVSRREETRPAQALPRTAMTALVGSLDFALTADQEEVLSEIVTDLGAEIPMARLLQGDVGSGKTIVALLSALPVIEAGHQVVLMAPTELLAQQHADTVAQLLQSAGSDVAVGFLSGSVPASARKPLLDAIATGSVDLVIGTHAVFTESVRFRNLRYAIVDEQHRFGVLQRLALVQKARQPDLLLMTATPIPRTLALTVFGDMSVSTIRMMPAGRKPVETHLARLVNEKKVHEFVGRELAAGRQAYFVYPVIDSSGKLDLRDAEGMWARLKDEVFPDYEIGLLHSRVKEEEKKTTMDRFRAGELQILVATSVVEVGVDVRNATCMVVEHAERFGLSALHQLRGRVGRGPDQSYCFLVYDDELTDVAKERLKTLHANTDGFKIAEEDLRIRGPGDIAGTEQSGYLRFRVADLARDMEIMNEARADAFEILETDPSLEAPENRTLGEALVAAHRQHRLTPLAYRDTYLPSEGVREAQGTRNTEVSQ
jgi:ATP-dependent DNA helicase RecG